MAVENSGRYVKGALQKGTIYDSFIADVLLSLRLCFDDPRNQRLRVLDGSAINC